MSRLKKLCWLEPVVHFESQLGRACAMVPSRTPYPSDVTDDERAGYDGHKRRIDAVVQVGL